MGPRKELETWVRPKLEAWVHRVVILDKILKQYPQSEYAGLRMSLQIEWHYLKRTVSGVDTLMGPI